MLGEKLKKLRVNKGLLQKDVAEKIGVSAAMISKYETGQKYPSQETLIKISKFYNVSINYLVSNSELNESSTNSATVYEQIKKYIREYEYELFKRTKNGEYCTEINKFLNVLKALDDRVTFEAYSNLDKEDDYFESLEDSVQILNYCNDLCKSIVSTIDYEEIDINKLYDTSAKSSNYIEPIINKLNKNIAILSAPEYEPRPNIKLYIDISKSNATMPIAAHNDNLGKDQQEKMKRDIAKLKNRKNNI